MGALIYIARARSTSTPVQQPTSTVAGLDRKGLLAGVAVLVALAVASVAVLLSRSPTEFASSTAVAHTLRSHGFACMDTSSENARVNGIPVESTYCAAGGDVDEDFYVYLVTDPDRQDEMVSEALEDLSGDGGGAMVMGPNWIVYAYDEGRALEIQRAIGGEFHSS